MSNGGGAREQGDGNCDCGQGFEEGGGKGELDKEAERC
jgi:hypothetical protein